MSITSNGGAGGRGEAGADGLPGEPGPPGQPGGYGGYGGDGGFAGGGGAGVWHVIGKQSHPCLFYYFPNWKGKKGVKIRKRKNMPNE